MSLVKHISPIALREQGIDLQVGDILICSSSYNRLIKIESIYEHETYKKPYVSYKSVEDWSYKTWSERLHYLSIDELLKQHKYNPLERGVSLEDYVKESLAVISGEKSISDYADKASDNVESETALVSSTSKTSLMALQNDLEAKQQKALIMQQFISLEMEKRKAEISEVLQKMSGVLTEFNKKIAKIMQVIATIELYLGVNEELFQIQDGNKAKSTEPITFRQQVLYMDEEIGHWKDGGLDYTNIDWFDRWLVENDNYKDIVPGEKCLVVFRPRRHDKEYNDAFYNYQANLKNKYKTYLLIRNGECLYRIYTENITILPRLFPRREELANIMDAINKDNMKGYSEKEQAEKADKALFEYKKRAILMQGLIDRSTVFHPLPAETVNIFKLEELGDKVRFIYDDEATLPSGRLSFKDWKDSINAKIGKGSRILVADRYDSRDVRDRIFFYVNDVNTPPSPEIGVYEVEEYEEENTWTFRLPLNNHEKEQIEGLKAKYKRVRIKEETKYEIKYGYYKNDEYTPKLTIMHNPKDTVYGGWGEFKQEERKKRIRFTIYKRDSEILNYDQISLDDVNFYINSRVDRPNYLKMMPTLVRIKEQRLKELELEKEFVKLVVAQNSHDLSSKQLESIEGLVWGCIEWWKNKNVWKRPIEKDDAKALRMISSELKRRLKWETPPYTSNYLT